MFNIQMEKEVISFPSTRSMPENTIPEPSSAPSKAEGDPELNELCSTIEYVVFKEENGVAVFTKHKQFVYDPSDLDADFGCIYDSLPQGDYTFYFIAHNSPIATLSESIFSFDEISDTFYKGLALEIGVAEEINESIVLDRIVSRIEFMATDPVTEAIKQFDMEIEGRAIRFDLADGAGIKTEGKETVSHTFTNEEIGIHNKIHSFYTFVPSHEKAISAAFRPSLKTMKSSGSGKSKTSSPKRIKSSATKASYTVVPNPTTHFRSVSTTMGNGKRQTR